MITDNPNECGLEIQNIQEKDNGEWTCTLTGFGPDDGNLESASGKIRIHSEGGKITSVVVANPPTESGANPFEGNLILTTATFLMIYQLLIR